MWVRTGLGAASFACLMTLAAGSWADEPDEATRVAARALGAAGVESFQAGKYAEASDKLEKAYGLLKVPSLGLWSARALAKRGLLVEAQERYLETTGLQAPSGDSAVQRKAQQDAKTDLAALKPRIPSLVIRLSNTDAAQVSLTLDGQPLAASWLGRPRLVDPGEHHVVAQRGADEAQGAATVAEGESKDVALAFKSTPVAAPSEPALATTSAASGPDMADTGQPSHAKRTLGWVALGAGAAGLAVGGVTGIIAAGKKSDLKNSGVCEGDRCPTSQADTVNSLNSMRTISTVGFIAGGVLAGTGIVLLLSSGSSSSAGSTQAWLSPTSFGLRRSF